MDYSLWREITISVGTALGLIGFFRAQEQRKEANFLELVRELSNSDSATLRATAASQLPAYFNYRAYLFFKRPYRHQAFMLAVHSLKEPNEERFVRQEAVHALHTMLLRRDTDEFPHPNLIGAKLDQLIMYGFPFDGADLTQASLRECDLGGASFARAKLWKAIVTHSKLSSANFSGAELWDADFSHSNLERANFRNAKLNKVNFFNAALWGADFSGAELENATLLTGNVDSQTRFDGAHLEGATISRRLVEVCKVDTKDLTVKD